MNLLRTYVDLMHVAVELTLNRVGLDTRDERGAISTEMAVVMGAMVAIAVAVGVILMAKAQSNANNIPDTVPAPG